MATLCKYLFWGNCSIALTATICSGQLKAVLTYIQIIGALLYVILKSLDDGLFWYHAEMARRKNSIQVAFNVSLSELETEEYYNNHVEPSVVKYAMNTYVSRF